MDPLLRHFYVTFTSLSDILVTFADFNVAGQACRSRGSGSERQKVTKVSFLLFLSKVTKVSFLLFLEEE